MTRHFLSDDLDNYRGHLCNSYPPVLRIEPGDTVVYRIPDAGWGLVGFDERGRRETVRQDVEEQRLGHCLAGPIAIKGAEPGMLLEVAVEELRTSDWGWTAVGWPTEMNDYLGIAQNPARMVRWAINPTAETATADFGATLPIAPFLGCMGVAPPMEGEFNTIEPYAGGGNMDCKELVAGSRLFLPVQVADALFVCGDCHAAQGDGELSGTAVECAAESVTLTFRLHDYLPELGLDRPVRPDSPVALTPSGWVVMGLHTNLDDAMKRAAGVMVELLQSLLGTDRHNAAAIAAAAVDFRVTQAVNGTKGVHALFRS